MKISLQSSGAVILTWIALMVLLFVHAFFGRQLATQLVYGACAWVSTSHYFTGAAELHVRRAQRALNYIGASDSH